MKNNNVSAEENQNISPATGNLVEAASHNNSSSSSILPAEALIHNVNAIENQTKISLSDLPLLNWEWKQNKGKSYSDKKKLDIMNKLKIDFAHSMQYENSSHSFKSSFFNVTKNFSCNNLGLIKTVLLFPVDKQANKDNQFNYRLKNIERLLQNISFTDIEINSILLSVRNSAWNAAQKQRLSDIVNIKLQKPNITTDSSTSIPSTENWHPPLKKARKLVYIKLTRDKNKALIEQEELNLKNRLKSRLAGAITTGCKIKVFDEILKDIKELGFSYDHTALMKQVIQYSFSQSSINIAFDHRIEKINYLLQHFDWTKKNISSFIACVKDSPWLKTQKKICSTLIRDKLKKPKITTASDGSSVIQASTILASLKSVLEPSSPSSSLKSVSEPSSPSSSIISTASMHIDSIRKSTSKNQPQNISAGILRHNLVANFMPQASSSSSSFAEKILQNKNNSTSYVEQENKRKIEDINNQNDNKKARRK